MIIGAFLLCGDKMDWTEIKIKVNSADTERASDIANMVVPYGIYIEDYTDLEEMALEIAHIDLIDEELVAKDRSVAFVHIYINPEKNPLEAIAFLSERYSAEGIEHSIEHNYVKESRQLLLPRRFFFRCKIGNSAFETILHIVSHFGIAVNTVFHKDLHTAKLNK